MSEYSVGIPGYTVGDPGCTVSGIGLSCLYPGVYQEVMRKTEGILV